MSIATIALLALSLAAADSGGNWFHSPDDDTSGPEIYRTTALDPTGHAIIIGIGLHFEHDMCAPHYAILHHLPPDTAPDVFLPGSPMYEWSRDGNYVAYQYYRDWEDPVVVCVADSAGRRVAAIENAWSPLFLNTSDTVYFLSEPAETSDTDYPRLEGLNLHSQRRSTIYSFDRGQTLIYPDFGGDGLIEPRLKSDQGSYFLVDVFTRDYREGWMYSIAESGECFLKAPHSANDYQQGTFE